MPTPLDRALDSKVFILAGLELRQMTNGLPEPLPGYGDHHATKEEHEESQRIHQLIHDRVHRDDFGCSSLGDLGQRYVSRGTGSNRK